MLRLRKILLSNKPYIIILIIVSLITLIRISIPKYSKYKKTTTNFTCIVDKYSIDQDKLTINLNCKDSLIGTYYFKNKEEVNKFKSNIKLGDKIQVIGELNKPSSNSTDNLFNYKNYLYNKNIFYTLNISTYKKISNNKNIIYKLKQLIRNNITNRYLYTFLLGDKSYLSTEVITSYQENGISHLFAVSGMHISLLSGLILKLLKTLKVEENKRYFITMIFLIIYFLLADSSPSITRGVLFFILFSLNNIYYFYIKPTNLFIIALSITLLINPFYIYDLGFQYSFLISLTLILTSKKLQSNNYFIGLLKVSIISFLISIPIQLKNFYQLNLLSIIYNLFFVPLISLIIFPFSLIVFLIKPLEPIYNLFIIILEKSSIFLSHINTFKLVFYKLPDIFYLLYLILIIFILYMYITKDKKKYIFILLFILLIHNKYNFIFRTNYLKLIDVGQGDSILIHSNNHSVLIDTGGKTTYQNSNFKDRIKTSSISSNTTIPLLKSLGIKKLDKIILTHGDQDHSGETINLIKNYNVKEVIINQGNVNYLEQNIINTKIKYSIVQEGQIIKVGKITLIELNKEFSNENDSSSVFLLIYKNTKILLMGDASITSEKYILNTYSLPEIDILKLGHHGSRTSTSEELLEEITPKLGLISCGKDNKFGHPHKETITKLNKYKVPYLRTDILGTITIKFNNKNYIIR